MSIGKMLKNILLLLAVCLTVLAAPAYAATGKTVVMGYYSDPGMMNGVGEGAVKSGYAYEYIQKLASYAGWRFRYEYGSFGELYRKLVAGEIDMLPYVGKSEQRMREIRYPDYAMGDEQYYIAALKRVRLSDSLTELQGKKVGTNAGSFHNGLFSRLAAEKGVSCEVVNFRTPKERWAALRDGKVDYTLETGTVLPNIEVSAVYNLGERFPYYLAVSPVRPDLLVELNEAHRQMVNLDPAFLENLRQNYFRGLPVQRELSEESLAWLDTHKTIRIGGFNKDMPYAIEEDKGGFSGIAPEYTRLMLDEVGVKLPLEWKFYDGKREALQALEAGEIDAINPYYHNYYDAEQDGVIISKTVYLSDFSVLYLGEYTDKTLSVIATPETRLGASYVRDNYPQAKIVPGRNGFDCIDMLLAGKANCVVLHTETLNKIAATYKKDFKIRALNTDNQVCFAALPENAPLIALIDKARPFVSDVELNVIRNKYNAEGTTSISLGNFLKAHPELMASAVAVLLAMALGMVMLRRKAEQAEKKIAEQHLLKQVEAADKLVDDLVAAYDIVFIINTADKSIEIRKSNANMAKGTRESGDSLQMREFFISKVVHPRDRERMRYEMELEVIRQKLTESPSYTVEYRVIKNGGTYCSELCITALGENRIIFGINEHDLALTKQYLEEKRYEEYFALHVTDLDTGMLRTIKNETRYSLTEDNAVAVPYTKAVLELEKEFSNPEAKAFFRQFSDLDYVRRVLATEDKYTFSYKSDLVGKWVSFTSYVIQRNTDGTPALFTLGFSLADSSEAGRQETQARIKQQLETISGLASGYTALYHANLDSGEYTPFFVSQKIEDIKAYIARNPKFSSLLHEFFDSELVLADDREALYEFYPSDEAVRSRLADKKEITVLFHRKYGTEFLWTEMSVIKCEAVSEPARMIVTGFREVHKEVLERMEARQAEMEKLQAESSSKAKSSFLFNMSHDIRTPMNAITGFTTMAKKYIDDKEKVTDYLNKIDVSGKQLLVLVNQVLEMARIESGKLEFDNKPVNIKEQFDSMVTVLAAQANVSGLEFNCTISNIKHFNVLADEARLGQITLNIAGNAIKYTPEGGKIDFSLKEIPCDREGFARYTLTVADTGIGMSEEFQKVLFEPFSREKTSTVSKIQGTGLGMPIVRNLIDLLGGTIEVQSELGKGTRFDITLDFEINAEAEGGTPADTELKFIPASFEGRRVLLVEDNELNREIAKDILEEVGLIVEEADDGDVAVSMVKAADERGEYNYYDIVLMDIQMPRMNGYEATRAIRGLQAPTGSHLPIIAMTANAFEEDRKNAFEAGMDAHLAKPIDVEKLLETLARFL